LLQNKIKGDGGEAFIVLILFWPLGFSFITLVHCLPKYFQLIFCFVIIVPLVYALSPSVLVPTIVYGQVEEGGCW